MNNRTLIITHETKPGLLCPDGAAGSWAVNKAYGNNTELQGEIYRQDNEWEEMYLSENGLQLPYDPRDRDVVFVDWAGYPFELMRMIASLANSVVVLDHHKTRTENLNQLGSLKKFYNGYVPTEIGCGFSIAWAYYFPLEPEPWFGKYVRSRDTNRGGYWQGELPLHEAVNSVISSMRRGKKGKEVFEVFDYLYSLRGIEELDLISAIAEVDRKNKTAWDEIDLWQQNPQFINLSAAYLYLLRQEVSDLLDGTETSDSRIKYIDMMVPYLKISNPKADRFYSWVGAFLSAVNHTDPFVIIQTSGDDSAVHLRKPIKSDADCGEIAAYFGGGGHAEAAGLPIRDQFAKATGFPVQY